MSDIIQAMSILRSALSEYSSDPYSLCNAIEEALVLMPREKAGKPIARATAKKVTPSIMRMVMHTFKRDPTRSNRSIGRKHGIDGGRVSEIINGKRSFKTGEMK